MVTLVQLAHLSGSGFAATTDFRDPKQLRTHFHPTRSPKTVVDLFFVSAQSSGLVWSSNLICPLCTIYQTRAQTSNLLFWGQDCLVLDGPISTSRLPSADGAVSLAERTLVGESCAGAPGSPEVMRRFL